MGGTTTNQLDYVSSTNNVEGQMWKVVCIENKIWNTQKIMISSIFIIPGDTTFINLVQVLPFINNIYF